MDSEILKTFNPDVYWIGILAKTLAYYILKSQTSFKVASLATTILLSICTPVRAFMFGTSDILFDRDTNINFTFQTSHGSYQSSLWVAQADSGNTGYSNITRLFYESQLSDNGRADMEEKLRHGCHLRKRLHHPNLHIFEGSNLCPAAVERHRQRPTMGAVRLVEYLHE